MVVTPVVDQAFGVAAVSQKAQVDGLVATPVFFKVRVTIFLFNSVEERATAVYFAVVFSSKALTDNKFETSGTVPTFGLAYEATYKVGLTVVLTIYSTGNKTE